MLVAQVRRGTQPQDVAASVRKNGFQAQDTHQLGCPRRADREKPCTTLGGDVLGVRDRRLDVQRGERVRKKSDLVKADLSKPIWCEAVRGVKIKN